jgi:hypothetical protein
VFDGQQPRLAVSHPRYLRKLDDRSSHECGRKLRGCARASQERPTGKGSNGSGMFGIVSSPSMSEDNMESQVQFSVSKTKG